MLKLVCVLVSVVVVCDYANANTYAHGNANTYANGNGKGSYLRPAKGVYGGRPTGYGDGHAQRPVKRVPAPAPAPVPRPQLQGGLQPAGGPAIAILRHDILMDPTGYQYAYETQNGIAGQEQASIKPTGPEQAQKSAQGSFSWTSPEGEQISVSYVADENGYQPQGSHIPTPPPIPPEIQRALEYIAAHPPQPEKAPGRRY